RSPACVACNRWMTSRTTSPSLTSTSKSSSPPPSAEPRQIRKCRTRAWPLLGGRPPGLCPAEAPAGCPFGLLPGAAPAGGLGGLFVCALPGGGLGGLPRWALDVHCLSSKNCLSSAGISGSGCCVTAILLCSSLTARLILPHSGSVIGDSSRGGLSRV